MPNPELTRRNRVEKKGTRRRPVEVIGSGGSEHQRVAGGSVGFKMARKRWKKHRSSENLIGVYEISARSSQNLIGSKGNSAEIWKNITGIWVF